MKLAGRSVTLFAWLVGAVGGAALVHLAEIVSHWLRQGISTSAVIVVEAIRLGLAIAGALLLGRWARSLPITSLLQRLSVGHLRDGGRNVKLSGWLVTLVAWLVGAIVGSAVLHLAWIANFWLEEGYSTSAAIAREAIHLAFPIAGALLLGRWARAHPITDLPQRVLARRIRSVCIVAVFGLYLATWAFGVPAVTSHLVQRDLEVYKDAYADKPLAYWKSWPRLESTFGAPLLPGVVLVYYDFQLGGQWGAGGWYVFAWWGTGEREIHFSWRRLS